MAGERINDFTLGTRNHKSGNMNVLGMMSEQTFLFSLKMYEFLQMAHM